MSSLMWNIDRMSQSELEKKQEEYIREALEMARRSTGGAAVSQVEQLAKAPVIRDIITDNVDQQIQLNEQGAAFVERLTEAIPKQEAAPSDQREMKRIIEEKIAILGNSDDQQKAEELIDLRNVIETEILSVGQNPAAIEELFDLKGVIESEIEMLSAGMEIPPPPPFLPNGAANQQNMSAPPPNFNSYIKSHNQQVNQNRQNGGRQCTANTKKN